MSALCIMMTTRVCGPRHWIPGICTVLEDHVKYSPLSPTFGGGSSKGAAG